MALLKKILFLLVAAAAVYFIAGQIGSLNGNFTLLQDSLAKLHTLDAQYALVQDRLLPETQAELLEYEKNISGLRIDSEEAKEVAGMKTELIAMQKALAGASMLNYQMNSTQNCAGYSKAMTAYNEVLRHASAAKEHAKKIRASGTKGFEYLGSQKTIDDLDSVANEIDLSIRKYTINC